jgi:hypothetical protein
MVLAQQPVKGQGLVDIIFDTAGELSVFARPLRDPGGQIAARLGGLAPVVERAQLLQTVAVDLARHVVERISGKMHATTLISRHPPPTKISSV